VSTQRPAHADSPALQATTHWPWLQVTLPFAGATQRVSHVPQCSTSRLRSKQASPQRLLDPLHWKSQRPALQIARAWRGALHAMVQLPQWSGSVRVSTHEPPQSTAGAVHTAAQVPLAHV
jgi:hypothetical protein